MQMADDVERAEYMRVMGPELGRLCHELQLDLWWLEHKWREYQELYARGQERIDLLNSVASNFFYFLNKLFFEDALLHLCRLTDPPRSCGRNTLSVMRLAEEVTDPALKSAVQTRADIAKNRCDFARDWRNQKLAHTDLESLRIGQAVVLPKVDATDIEDAMKTIDAVLTFLEAHHGIPHSISIRDPWGAKSLIGYLSHGKKLREQELDGWRRAVKNAQ
jgi:hypothetical protein